MKYLFKRQKDVYTESASCKKLKLWCLKYEDSIADWDDVIAVYAAKLNLDDDAQDVNNIWWVQGRRTKSCLLDDELDPPWNRNDYKPRYKIRVRFKRKHCKEHARSNTRAPHSSIGLDRCLTSGWWLWLWCHAKRKVCRASIRKEYGCVDRFTWYVLKKIRKMS